MTNLMSFFSEDKYKHCWPDPIETPLQVNGDGRRYYKIGDKKYPSMTSVLSMLCQSDEIDNWKKAVGEEEAARVSKRATFQGSLLHENIEEYLLNHRVNIDKRRLLDVGLFKAALPELHKINNIRCLEDPLFSHALSMAGTVDCIAEYNGELAIVDFKTSKHRKSKEDIPSYFTQCTGYSFMYQEMYKETINKLVILMAVQGDKCLVFEDDRRNWISEMGKAVKIAKQYVREELS